MNKTCVVEINNLSKQYGKNVQALDKVSLCINEGEIFGLLGPNGAGKTTLINCITSIATIGSGEIVVLGHDVVEDYIIARLNLGLSPQELRFDLYFTTFEILVYQAGFYGIGKKEGIKRAEKMLKLFDLYDKKDKTIRELSGGMQRKFSLAKAMIHNPKIIILDEPTAALDINSRLDLWKYIKKVNKEGVTVLLTTHYIEEAEELCDRICIINKGKIVKLDEKDQIMQTLSENVIIFSLEKQFTKSNEKLLKGYKYRIRNGHLEIIASKNEQAKVMKNILVLLEKNKIKYTNFEVREDSLENIFLRILKNDQ